MFQCVFLLNLQCFHSSKSFWTKNPAACVSSTEASSSPRCYFPPALISTVTGTRDVFVLPGEEGGRANGRQVNSDLDQNSES